MHTKPDLMTDEQRHDALLAAVKALAHVAVPWRSGPPAFQERALYDAIAALDRDAEARTCIAVKPKPEWREVRCLECNATAVVSSERAAACVPLCPCVSSRREVKPADPADFPMNA